MPVRFTRRAPSIPALPGVLPRGPRTRPAPPLAAAPARARVTIPTWRPDARPALGPPAQEPVERDAQARQTSRRGVSLLALVAGVAIVASAWLPAGPRQIPAFPAAEEPFLEAYPVVVVADRMVCSLLGDQQGMAGVTGEDGAHSVALDGVVFWNFGDTVLSKGRLNPNGIGWSGDRDASDCISLVPKGESTGAVALLSKAPDDELTVWPLGMEATSPDRVYFYYASIVGGSEDDAQVAGVGLASFDPHTLEAERAFDGKLPWRAGTPLPFRTYADDEYVYIFLDASREEWSTQTILARVPKDQIEALGSYEYWEPGGPEQTGTWVSGLWNEGTDSWSPLIQTIDPLWSQPGRHNGIEVAYNGYLGRWLAVYTSAFMTTLNIRAAEELTGPWDGPETVAVDCPAFHPPQSDPFICYSGAQHELYARDGGRTIYVSYSNGDDYQVYLHELRLGAAITQWSDARGRTLYLAGQTEGPAGFRASGIAFYASDVPVPGFAPIHRWLGVESGRVRYGATQPYEPETFLDMGVDFYTPTNAVATETAHAQYAPVYRWSRDGVERYSALDLSRQGYAQREIAFYAACPDADGDALSDCSESFLGTDAAVADSDGDGLPDGYEDSTQGCNPLVYDDDGDGIAPLEEVFAGTNPCQRGALPEEPLVASGRLAGLTEPALQE